MRTRHWCVSLGVAALLGAGAIAAPAAGADELDDAAEGPDAAISSSTPATLTHAHGVQMKLLSGNRFISTSWPPATLVQGGRFGSPQRNGCRRMTLCTAV